MFFTTGAVARKLGISREAILIDIYRLGIKPLRDSTGRRLLTEQDAEQIAALHKQRRRRHEASVGISAG